MNTNTQVSLKMIDLFNLKKLYFYSKVFRSNMSSVNHHLKKVFQNVLPLIQQKMI